MQYMPMGSMVPRAHHSEPRREKHISRVIRTPILLFENIQGKDLHAHQCTTSEKYIFLNSIALAFVTRRLIG